MLFLLLFHYSQQCFTFPMLAYPGYPGKEQLNGCNVVNVVAKLC